MGPADIKKVEALILPILEGLGLELVQVRFMSEQGRSVLQILIDRGEINESQSRTVTPVPGGLTAPGTGVTVGDCETVSRQIETILEVEEAVHAPYSLEVSSPGLERPLTKEADFARFAGRVIALKTRGPWEGRQNYKGVLVGMEEGTIRMTIDGQAFRIPFAELDRAHLVFEGREKGEKRHVGRSHTYP